VFVDDSNFEINLIKEQLPEVLTIQVPTSISDYPNLILNTVNTYFNLVLNQDDIRKTDMYKQQLERYNDKSKFYSIDDYLASLEIELIVKKNVKSLAPRIAQLTLKTNQFNLTTIRYTEMQIEQFCDDPKIDIYSINVNDKFGDSGLTGICILKQDYDNREAASVDTLLMSCRIIGRNIEYKFMDFILRDLVSRGFSKLTACYVPTFKNSQVESFYEKIGFNLLDANTPGTKTYSLEINEYKFSNIDYIKII
jgi:FkbH-like protein